MRLKDRNGRCLNTIIRTKESLNDKDEEATVYQPDILEEEKDTTREVSSRYGLDHPTAGITIGITINFLIILVDYQNFTNPSNSAI